MNTFLQELKKFSKENWWIYLLFIFALIFVIYSWSWNIIEIIILFLANFFANIFIMAMQANYTAKKNKLWAIFQVLATLIFIVLWIYWMIYLDRYQYIIWQIAYTISAIKAFFYYNYWKNLKFLNSYFLIILNIFFLIIFYKYFFSWNLLWFFWTELTAKNFSSLSDLLLWIWFSFSSTWFVMIDDKKRYFTILIWTWLIVIWALIWVVSSYFLWNIDWIALGYFILTLTVWIFYLKLLKKYLKG